MFQQPKMDLHVKIVRLLPTFDRVLCHGNVVRYRIRFLGSDGDVHCFDVCLASDDLGQRLDSVTSEVRILCEYAFVLTAPYCVEHVWSSMWCIRLGISAEFTHT